LPLVRKFVKIDSKLWEKVINLSKDKDYRIPAEQQGAILIKEALENREKAASNEKIN